MQVELNSLEDGLSGRLGDVVYFRLKGKTFVRKAPGHYNKIPSAKQRPVRNRFADAVRFAKAVVADPALKALYTKKANGQCSAYAKAVSVYMQSNDDIV